MDKKLKVGIIGCGGIANGKHMPNLAKIPEVELVAFCDIIVERAQNAAQKYGIEGAKVYTDYRELLADKSIDVVHVLTPNKWHSEITIAALEADKHVMCEKPMAINAAEAMKMYKAWQKSNKKLSFGYQYRCLPIPSYSKQLVEAGELGEIYFAKAHAVRRRGVPTWGVFLDAEAQGGGPLIDIGTHALDMTLWLMDNYEPHMVVGTTFSKLRELRGAGNPWGDWDIDKFTVEDSAFGFIKMKNGATIILESSWALNTIEPREAQATLCGTKAGLDMKDKLTLNYSRNGRQCIETPDLNVGGVAFYAGTSAREPAFVEARRWIDAVLNDTEPFVTPKQALVVSQILDAIYESARTDKPVYLD